MDVTPITRVPAGGLAPTATAPDHKGRSFVEAMRQESAKAEPTRAFKDVSKAAPATPAASSANTIGAAATPATPAPTAAAAGVAAPGTRKGPKGESIEAVPNHAYAEITGGPRNGMYLNTCGNARDGKAFTMVERDGWEYHIYGTGKDRELYRIKDAEAADPAATADPPATTSPTTGATAASGS